MKICKNLGVFLLLGPFFLTVFGQNQPYTAQDFEVIHSVLPQDQPYMLFSKGVYETGEDMWFKAWLFDRSFLTLSNRSRTLFLRIYDSTDSLVWNEKYPISGGRAEGHVFIGEKWNTGEYRVEGYTQSSFYADSTEAIFPQKSGLLTESTTETTRHESRTTERQHQTWLVSGGGLSGSGYKKLCCI